MKKYVRSFRHAFNGLIHAFKTQHNYKVHSALSITAFILGYVLEISYEEFLIIIVFIFIGLTIEMVNTALEATCDAIDKNYRDDIKIAKDLSAAAMLIFSLGAFVTACIIFIPKLLAFLFS